MRIKCFEDTDTTLLEFTSNATVESQEGTIRQINDELTHKEMINPQLFQNKEHRGPEWASMCDFFSLTGRQSGLN